MVTVTVQEAEGALSLVPAVAVMMAVPSATAVTKPALETVATLVLLLVQTTSSVVFSGSTVAVSVAVLGSVLLYRDKVVVFRLTLVAGVIKPS